MLTPATVVELLASSSGDASLAANYEQAIEEALAARELDRNPIWTESIAVGGESFVSEIEKRT